MRWRRLRRSGFCGREGGQSALEFVLVLPFVFVVIFLVAEATSILKTWMLLENASREGARYAAVRKTAVEVCTQTQAKAGGILDGAPCACGGGGICVTNAKGIPGSDTSVAITYLYTYKTPLIPLIAYLSGGAIDNTVTMNARTVMRLE